LKLITARISVPISTQQVSAQERYAKGSNNSDFAGKTIPTLQHHTGSPYSNPNTTAEGIAGAAEMRNLLRRQS
jgi:hypothetical protein